jgi:hypothetical protein
MRKSDWKWYLKSGNIGAEFLSIETNAGEQKRRVISHSEYSQKIRLGFYMRACSYSYGCRCHRCLTCCGGHERFSVLRSSSSVFCLTVNKIICSSHNNPQIYWALHPLTTGLAFNIHSNCFPHPLVKFKILLLKRKQKTGKH